MGKSVLPPMPPSKYKSMDDLLTPEQLEELHTDLAKMAKQRQQAEDASAHIRMALAADNEVRWRSGGEGRLDIDGVRWWACDPYPTWYRWEDGVLHKSGWAHWAEGSHPLDTPYEDD